MTFRIRRKLLSDPEFLGLPPEVRETFISAFRELAVAETPVQRTSAWYVEELHQRKRTASQGIYSVHVKEGGGKRWPWRGVFFRRGNDLVFFGFGPRVPDFYVRMARAREALSRKDDER